MRIGFAANPGKPAGVRLARRAVDRIGGRAEVVLTDEIAKALGQAGGVPLEELEADVLVAFGGDGTFLYTLRRTGVPLLPVHTGTVGFLAEVDGERVESFDDALERVLEGRYFVEDRMKLAAEIEGRPLPDAVNELVVHTSQVAKMRPFEIAIEEEPVGEVRADGVILATPTGSTSYALSALGPILDPSVEAIVVATLAPFRVTQRAVVVDPLKTVSIRPAAPGKEAVVVVDGQSDHPLSAGEWVRAYRSSRRASFVRFGSRFFHRLRGKRILPWQDGTPADPGGDADLPPPA